MPGKRRMTARAMTWAQLWRSTSRASGSLSVMTWNVCSPSGNSRSRSMMVPSRRAATAAWASRLPMPSVTWRAVAWGGASLVDPSGSRRVDMIKSLYRRGPFRVMLRSGHAPGDRGSTTGPPRRRRAAARRGKNSLSFRARLCHPRWGTLRPRPRAPILSGRATIGAVTPVPNGRSPRPWPARSVNVFPAATPGLWGVDGPPNRSRSRRSPPCLSSTAASPAMASCRSCCA